MNIYSICMEYKIDCDFGEDVGFEYDYLMHEELFTKEEFDKMCEDCLSKCKDKWNYSLKTRLISDYGFKKLSAVCNFDYDEKMED